MGHKKPVCGDEKLLYPVYNAFYGFEATFQTHIVVKYYRVKYNREGMKYSSHKLMNAARVRTLSKKPVPVLLYVGLGFVLMNIYVYIQWTYLCIRRRGGRKPVPWTFKNMLRQITRKIDDEFGFVDWTPISVILLKKDKKRVSY